MNPNWPTKKLGEVATVFNGKTFGRDQYRNHGRLKTIKVKDFDETRVYFDKDENGWIDLDVSDNLLLKKGDTLIINAAHSATHVGSKIGYCDIKPPLKSVPSGEIMVIRPKGIEPLLLNALIRSVPIRRKIKDLVRGIHLYPKDMASLKIPLPPLVIQKQIVERLDKIAEAQKLNDDLIQKSDELFQSLLHKELDPKDKNWNEEKLGEICDVRDGTHESPKFYPSGVPLITSKNLIGEGVDFENINYISLEDHRKIDKRSRVDDGDILFGMIGTIGNPVIVKKDREFSIKNVGLIKPTTLSPINYFIYYSLLGNFIQKQVKKFSRGGTQKFVSLGNLRSLKIIVPNKIIQKQIVAKLSAAQEYKTRLLAQKSLLKELFDSVLDRSMTPHR